MSQQPELFVSRQVYWLFFAYFVMVLGFWGVVAGGGLVYFVFVAMALVFGLLTPWKVSVRAEGLVLSFAFRRAIELAKTDATVWVMRGRKAIAFLGDRPRPGRFFRLPVSPARSNFVGVLEANGFRVITDLPRA